MQLPFCSFNYCCTASTQTQPACLFARRKCIPIFGRKQRQYALTHSQRGRQPAWLAHSGDTNTNSDTDSGYGSGYATDSGYGYGYGNDSDSDSGFSRITKTSARFADLKPAPASAPTPALKGKQPARCFPAPILKQGKTNKFRTRFLDFIYQICSLLATLPQLLYFSCCCCSCRRA